MQCKSSYFHTPSRCLFFEDQPCHMSSMCASTCIYLFHLLVLLLIILILDKCLLVFLMSAVGIDTFNSIVLVTMTIKLFYSILVYSILYPNLPPVVVIHDFLIVPRLLTVCTCA